MTKFKIVLIVLVALLFSTSISNTYTKVGRTKKKKKPYSSTVAYTAIKYNLVLKGNVGSIINSDEDYKTFLKPDNKFYYGIGFAFEYHTKGHFAFGINYDKLSYKYAKNSSIFLKNSVTVNQYSISAIYKLFTQRTSIPIVSVYYGAAEINLKGYSGANFGKVGIGILGHTSGKINFRVSLYYQQFLSTATLEKYIKKGQLKIAGVEVLIGLPL